MILKQLLPHNFRQALKRQLFVVRDMRNRLANLKAAGFKPTCAIDGGAYQGEWTKDFWDVFPGIPVLLVEPQPHCQESLQKLAQECLGSKVLPVALSSTNGEANFRLGESNSGIMRSSEISWAMIQVKTQSLDDILRNSCNQESPNLLKLDLQGHELDALEGCSSSLDQFEVVILEVSILRIGDVPIFHEVDAYMESHGFRLYDIIPQYYRPLDGALWQVDAFFVRHDSSLISSRAWG